MSKPRVKAGKGPAPQSVAAAEAAEDLKNRMEGNGIAQGQTAVAPPPDKPEGAPTRAERRKKAAEKPKPSDIPKQGRLGRKAQEQELPGMPALDGVGKAARKFLDARDAVETAKDNQQEAMSNVINALKRAKRKTINCDGYTIEYVHKEAVDRLKVKKPSTK